MVNKCPKCGGEFSAGEQCRERFELCLTKDYEHPASYGAVHHLIVACYMLQHNEYSRTGWLGARELVEQAIRDGLTPSTLRQQNRRRLSSDQRSWSITQGAKIDAVDAIVWTHTIADVRLDTPEAYCADARRWARSVLADTEALMRELETEV